MSRYVKHTRREIITAFLLLTPRDNVVLKQILHDPHHPAYLPLIDDLLHHPHPGIARLLLGFLDDPRAPSSAISVLIRRDDLQFIRNLLRKIGSTPSAAATANLKRVDSISWLRHDDGLIDQLNDAEQHSLVQLIMTSSMKRLEAFKTIDLLVRHGKPGGRLAAVEALAQFGGAEANCAGDVGTGARRSGDPGLGGPSIAAARHPGRPKPPGGTARQFLTRPIRQALPTSGWRNSPSSVFYRLTTCWKKKSAARPARWSRRSIRPPCRL